MKNILFSLIIMMLGNSIIAQISFKNLPISISYFSAFGFHPGAKIGTQFDLKNWETEAKQKSFFVSPQIGFYSRPNIHISYLVNADFGYKRVKSEKQKYSAWSIGLGFLNQAQVVSQQVNLSDGSKEKVRENWAWFLPTLNYEFGKAINEKIGWYGKFSYGIKMASERENTSVLFVELGIHLNLF